MVGIMLGLTVGAAGYPTSLHLNRLLDGAGLKSYEYRVVLAEPVVFEPVESGLPKIDYFKRTAYWERLGPDARISIQLRRGGFGMWQFNIADIVTDIRRFQRGEKPQWGYPRQRQILPNPEVVSAVVSFAEDRRSDAYHRRSFPDRFDIVAAHAHGQLAEIGQCVTNANGIAQFSERGKGAANFQLTGRVRADAHEPAQTDAGHLLFSSSSSKVSSASGDTPCLAGSPVMLTSIRLSMTSDCSTARRETRSASLTLFRECHQ